MITLNAILFLQGTVRTTLTKLKDSAASRSHELVEEMLSLQETLDTLLHSLTERTEENASLTVDVSLQSTRYLDHGFTQHLEHIADLSEI